MTYTQRTAESILMTLESIKELDSISHEALERKLLLIELVLKDAENLALANIVKKAA